MPYDDNFVFFPLDLENCTVSGNQVIYRGQNISLTCHGNGHPYPLFTWFFQGEKLISNSRIRLKGNQLHIFNATINDGWEFRCVAFNQYHNVSCGQHITVIGLYEVRLNWIYIAVCNVQFNKC